MYAPLMTSVIATVASMNQPNVLVIAAIVDAFGILGQLLINAEIGQVPISKSACPISRPIGTWRYNRPSVGETPQPVSANINKL